RMLNAPSRFYPSSFSLHPYGTRRFPMNTTAAVKISHPQTDTPSATHLVADEFIGLGDLNTVRNEIFHNQSLQVLFEIEEFSREDRWEDILIERYRVI
ncbi:MAG: hypothetical protein WA151_18040, partial [Desulfatirhabdiaceae bacterium]